MAIHSTEFEFEDYLDQNFTPIFTYNFKGNTSITI